MKTDLQLQRDVMAELKWEPSVKAAHIGVQVADGIVTLGGHVGSVQEKWHAEQATQRVDGVKALAVELKVHLPSESQRTDGEIAHAAANVLEWLTYLPKDSVKVRVENGWVTLTGAVDWEYQRKAALAAIRPLMGVTGVSGQIELSSKISITTIEADISASLKRRAEVDAQKIAVEVSGSAVTLTGKVSTWAEHELVTHCAWGTAGVRNVVDNLIVG